MTLSIKTLRIMTFIMNTLSITDLSATLSVNDTQNKQHYVSSIIVLSVVMLSVIKENAVMLSVVAPRERERERSDVWDL